MNGFTEHKLPGVRLFGGDSEVVLPFLLKEEVDSIVCDPPAGINFLSKSWDSDKGGRDEWIKWLTRISREMLRTLKPGGHALVWALPRTSHWTATALENAGFEIRDVVTHIFGSGFPKSHNVGDMGSGLKPATENWILCRKQLVFAHTTIKGNRKRESQTIAETVVKHGTGGLNIAAARVGKEKRFSAPAKAGKDTFNCSFDSEYTGKEVAGRWPANLVLDEAAAAILDEQSGHLHGPGNKTRTVGGVDVGMFGNGIKRPPRVDNICDSAGGGASRFFYCAKASKRDRGEGNDHPTPKNTELMSYLIKLITPPGGIVLDCFMGSGSTGVAAVREGFKFIGIERDNHYMRIAEKRISNAKENVNDQARSASAAHHK